MEQILERWDSTSTIDENPEARVRETAGKLDVCRKSVHLVDLRVETSPCSMETALQLM